MDEIHPAKHRESKNADQFMDEFGSLSDSTQDNKASMKNEKMHPEKHTLGEKT